MNPTFQTDSNYVTSKELPSKESNTYSSTTYEYVTKGRKTLYDSSLLNLQSPKKQNPSRSKRIELLKIPPNKNSKNKTNIEQKNYNINLIYNNNITYKPLIKKIAIKLKRRVNFPTAKIIKIYQPYRTLILRIAKGIKNTAKSFNLWNIYEKNITRAKYGITLMKKENNDSKNKISSKNSKQIKEMNENINVLLSIDDSNKNADFINEFEIFLGKNGVKILTDTKLPSFNNKDNDYLLNNINFWTKYINFICWKYKTELSFFHFINFIEQFYIWISDEYDTDIFNRLIIEKIESTFDRNQISDFLLMHKLQDLEDLFSRYKKLNKPEYKEIKGKEDCQCATCEKMKIKQKPLSAKKFPISKTLLDNDSKSFTVNNNNSKDYKITNYYRCSIKLRPSKIQTERKLVEHHTDKKIVDYFNFTKTKKDKDKKKSKSRSKSKSKNKSKNRSKSKKNKNKNNDKRISNDKMQEIKDLLNL